MCNETKHQCISPKCLSNALEIWLTSLCQQLPGCGARWDAQSFSGHSFVLFQEVPRPISRHLPPTALLEGPRTESCLSPKQQLIKASGRLPAARYHYSPACIHSHFKPLFPTGVLPKHRGTKAQQLTEIKSDISTICLKNVRPLTH